MKQNNLMSLAICISSQASDDMEIRKIYQVLPDRSAGMLRVIDESGEDYLNPAASFIPVPNPASN